MTKFEKSESLIDSVTQQYGHISILVNNAGMHQKKAAIDVTEEEFLQVLNVNVLGSFSLSRQVAKKMLVSSKGNILFIASMTSLIGMPSVTAYSAAKISLSWHGAINGHRMVTSRNSRKCDCSRIH